MSIVSAHSAEDLVAEATALDPAVVARLDITVPRTLAGSRAEIATFA